MPQRKKRIDENIIFPPKQQVIFPEQMILKHCKIKFPQWIISISNDKHRNGFDLYREDLEVFFPLDKELNEDEENLLYVNLLLGTLLMIDFPYRKVFIIYQASLQPDPVAWLECFKQVMATHQEEISCATDEKATFYYTTLTLLSDIEIVYMVHRKNDKMSVSWNGGSAQFVELILALYNMEHEAKYETGTKIENILKCGPDIKSETTLINAMAHKFNFPIDDIFNHIEGIKRRKRRDADKARFLYDLIDSLNAYCKQSDE